MLLYGLLAESHIEVGLILSFENSYIGAPILEGQLLIHLGRLLSTISIKEAETTADASASKWLASLP